MKKQTKKLTLHKSTLSNLHEAEMNKKLGGGWTTPCHSWGCPPTRGCGQTKNGNTCIGHNTCYTCVTCA